MNATVSLIMTALSAIQSLLPTSSSSSVTKIINTLVQVIPVATTEASELLPVIQTIITTLKSGNVTSDQLTALKALDAQVDAAYDAALAAYLANHPAAA